MKYSRPPIKKEYLSLKETAKKLGFKYAWHCNGRFLVRWREGERPHVIRTAFDLGSLRASLGDTADPSRFINAVLTSLPSQPNRHLRKFKCSFLNATCLKKHIWGFWQVLLQNTSYDIFGVAESSLGPEVDDGLIQISGYSVLRCDRNTGGGCSSVYTRYS